MAKPDVADEVQVLRFFEQGSIEKAEVMFNIVSEKMRERMCGHPNKTAQAGSPRKRPTGKKPEPTDSEPDEEGSHT